MTVPELSPELFRALSYIRDHPLERLPAHHEQQLMSLGLIRPWEGYTGLTELGRRVAGPSGGSAEET